VKLEDFENKGIEVLRRSWVDVLQDYVSKAVPDEDQIATATDNRLLGA
jgi:hypothetical protein